MTRTISANLKSHYQGHIKTIARCWKITRTDATNLYFTDHDTSLTISGDTYKSLNSGKTTKLHTKDNLGVDTLDIEVVLNSSDISEDDIKAGRYDNAEVWIFEVNYNSTADGTVTLSYGNIGEVELHDNFAKVEFRSLSQRLQKNIGRSYTINCDAQLGDTRCGLSLSTLGYTSTAHVDTVTDRAVFITAGATGSTAYVGGRIEWTSGTNNGLSMEITSWTSATMRLQLPMPFNPSTGDEFTAYYGCDKTLATCRDTYNNVVNFRGFPHLPGIGVMVKYPDSNR